MKGVGGCDSSFTVFFYINFLKRKRREKKGGYIHILENQGK
jgi:hypothetical protein